MRDCSCGVCDEKERSENVYDMGPLRSGLMEGQASPPAVLFVVSLQNRVTGDARTLSILPYNHLPEKCNQAFQFKYCQAQRP